MFLADLHVHSRYSKHPSEWFLQRIGAAESYTDVEEVYRQAKARGMSAVTLTDHNTIDGALELRRLHPVDTFVSVEATTYFPEDGCKVHVLAYDITPEQFSQIDTLRTDIYALRDYLRAESIACSVAHATYSVNDRLTVDTLEKLVLLFDVFEAINGGRNQLHNKTWSDLLMSLTPAHIERLRGRHAIEPWSEDSWKKGFTGGSDDHAGLLIGQVYTLGCDDTTAGFFDQLRRRETRAAGRHADHKSLACAIYKIAHRFSQTKGSNASGNPLALLNTLFFDHGKLGLKNWLAVQKLKRRKGSANRAMLQCVEELLDGRNGMPLDGEAQIERMYQGLATLSDGFFALLAESLEKDLQRGDAGRLLGNLSSALPALFLLTPLLSVLRHMHRDRELLNGIAERFGRTPSAQRKVLWFSDTVTDLNGVAVTMREIAACAHASGRPVKLAACLPPEPRTAALPPGILDLPCIYAVTPDFYNAWTLRLPSLLRSIDLIAREAPDEIVISTPGPVGLVGLAAARLLQIKCSGVYHTDFTKQADLFINDHWVSAMIESYTRGFFTMMDEVRVPTTRYMDMLAERGLERAKMKLFSRGIADGFAVHDEQRQAAWRQRLRLPADHAVLLWAGRLGREKNLDFLFEVYRDVLRRRPQTVLLLAGDGPELERLRRESRDLPNVVFAGRVERADLPHLYSLADAFVFPSTTDTFGMVVLEAQACGLPVVVSDVGGPQELVRRGETGFVVAADRLSDWTAAVHGVLDIRENDPEVWSRMKDAARAHAARDGGWERLLDDMTGVAEPSSSDIGTGTAKNWSDSPRTVGARLSPAEP
jgi:glycosyltransferase involved in cell wall biosynthesis